MPKVHYERESKLLSLHDVSKAILMSRARDAKARIIEWKDTDCTGLTLRITKSEASWLIRKRDRTIRIGLWSGNTSDHRKICHPSGS